MDEETLAISSEQLPYFRTDEFSQIMFESDAILKKLLGTVPETKSMYLTASGTAAMEAAVMNMLTKDDKALIIDGGLFGRRFVKLCLEVHGIPYEAIDVPFGTAFSGEMLQPYKNKGFTAMLVNLHETSTGQLYDINEISKFCKSENICLIIDAISTFLVDDFEMDRFGIAATIISSQKGLGLAPGLSMLYINEETYKKRVKNNTPATLYLNFNDYVTDMQRGQTPYTPAVGILLQLHEKLKRIEEITLKKVIDNNYKLALHFRKRLNETMFTYPDYPLSNSVTPVFCPQDNAEKIISQLIEKWEIYVVPNPKPHNNDYFRAGHMGMGVTIQDMDLLIEKLKELEHLNA